MIIDTKKQSVVYTQNWMQPTTSPTNISGALIITNDKNSGSYNTSTINCLEYISECTFSFIPRDADLEDGVTFTGEFVRLYDVEMFGASKTIDIAGVPEGNERNGIIFAVISALITTLRATNDTASQHTLKNQLNAIPFAVCYTDLEGRIMGYNYRFENLAFEGEIQPDSLEQLSIADIRLDMDKSRWEDRYIAKNRRVLNDVELLNTGRWHSVSKTYFLHHQEDEPVGIVGIVEDISQQPLKIHEELRMDLINSIFLKRILSGSNWVAFIIECSGRLPVMYLSNNMEMLGLDGDKTLDGDFYFADYIHEDDRQQAEAALTGEEGLDIENRMHLRVNTVDGSARRVLMRYTKVRYIHRNSIIAYGVIIADSQ